MKKILHMLVVAMATTAMNAQTFIEDNPSNDKLDTIRDLIKVPIDNETPTNSLVAYYPFTGGSLEDFSGNENDAIGGGATGTTDINGEVNNALNFNVRKHVRLDAGLLLKPKVSISLWFKSGFRGGILGYQNDEIYKAASTYVPIVYLGSDAKIRAGFWSGAKRSITSTGATLADNKWHHLVLTANETEQELFIDNVSMGTMAYGHTILSNITQAQLGVTRTIGWAGNGGADWFDFNNGNIDNVRIYSDKLTAQQVAVIFEDEKQTPEFDFIVSKTEVDFEDTYIQTTKTDTFYIKAPSTNTGDVEVQIVFDEDRNNECPIINGPPTPLITKDIFQVSVNGVELVSEYSVFSFPINEFAKGNATVTIAPGDSAEVIIEATPGRHLNTVLLKGDETPSCEFKEDPSSSLGLQSDEISIRNITTASKKVTFVSLSFTGTNDPVSINSIFKENSKPRLNIHPNPASSTIHTEVGQLEIMDYSGRLVLSTYSSGKVDVSTIQPGNYLVIQGNKRAKLSIN